MKLFFLVGGAATAHLRARGCGPNFVSVLHIPAVGGRCGWYAAAWGLLAVAAPLDAGGDQTPACIAPAVAPQLAAAYCPPEKWHDLLRMDDEMRRYFGERIPRRAPDLARLQAVVHAITGTDGLHFQYEASGSYDVRESFRRRRGNCQSFAFLVVALTREFGLDAKFQDMEGRVLWNRYGRYVAAVRHTNVLVRAGDETYVVDPRPDLGWPARNSGLYVVNDARAASQFYSTSAFFRMVAGDVDGATRLAAYAATVDPTSPIAWSNLGHLQAQRGDLAAARHSFERALKLDAREDAAYTGLVDVLRRIGGPAELKAMAVYERRAQSSRERNPYYVYQLGSRARELGDLATAEKHLRRAIRLKDDEPLFHEDLAAILRASAREREARRLEQRAARLRATLAAQTIPLGP